MPGYSILHILKSTKEYYTSWGGNGGVPYESIESALQHGHGSGRDPIDIYRLVREAPRGEDWFHQTGKDRWEEVPGWIWHEWDNLLRKWVPLGGGGSNNRVIPARMNVINPGGK